MRAANDNGLGVPPGIYDMVEAATFLRIGRRKLQDLIKTYPFYALNGNRKRFSQTQIEQIYEAMTCQNSSSTGVLDLQTTTFAGLETTGSQLTKVQKLTMRPQQKQSSSRRKLAS